MFSLHRLACTFMCRIEVLTDEKVINEFLLHEVIFQECFEDGEEREERELDFRNWAYLGCYGDGLEALMECRIVNLSTLELHFKALPHIRGKKALNYAKATISHIFDKLSVNKLNTLAPEYRKQNQRFIVMCGFQREGISRESFYKDGRYWDQICYGLTRSDYGL